MVPPIEQLFPGPTLTVARAQAIVAHAENEFGAGDYIQDAFAPFARGGASTRAEASNALYIVIADYFGMASRPGAAASVMQDFSKYAKASEFIAWHLIMDAADNLEVLGQVARSDTRETLDSFVRYLRTLDPNDPGFFPSVYQRLGLTYPAEPRIKQSSVAAPSVNKPWWRFW